MHSSSTVASALRLHEEGLNNCEIARRTGVSRPTIREWINGRLPHSYRPPNPDGRITLDVRYPGIVEECERSMRRVVPRNRVGRQLRRCNCYEVHAYSKGWPCLFHNTDPEKAQPLDLLGRLATKARRTVAEAVAQGLIQSDGCRSYSTGKGDWTQPRYAFSNVSTDITSIFCSACDCLGLHWTASFPTNESAAVSIYVSGKADVARLDEFVGPKR